MPGDVIVTVTLNAALHVSYAAGDASPDGVRPISRPGYRAGGRGVTAARMLRSFGHDVLAAGLAGGTSGELIRADLARSGVPTAFTMIRGESRRVFRFTGSAPAGQVLRFGELGPFITTEELGRFAADYRSLLAGAAAVVLCGSLPDGLPPETYGTLVTYAVEARVPVILDAGGEELRHAVGHGPDLVVAETSSADPGLGAALIRRGAAAAAVATGHVVRVVSAEGEWTARVTTAAGDPPPPSVRGALVAGLVPGQLLGWSWPDRLRHALALAAAGELNETGLNETGLNETGLNETGLAETGLEDTGLEDTGLGQTRLGQTRRGQTRRGQTRRGQTRLGQTRRGQPGAWSAATPAISTSAVRDHVDLAAYERLLDAVTVERSS